MIENLTETEKSYLAGLYDGEGYIGIIRADQSQHSPRHKSPSYRLCVQLSNTNKDMIDWVRDKIGGLQYYTRFENVRHKPCYHLHASSKNAVNLLEAIKPYIIAKQKQLELGLELQRTVDIYRKENPRNKFFPGQPLSQAEIDKRELIYQKMRELNNGWKWNREHPYQTRLRRQV